MAFGSWTGIYHEVKIALLEEGDIVGILVLEALTCHADGFGLLEAGLTRLSKLTKIARDGVAVKLLELQDRGWIKIRQMTDLTRPHKKRMETQISPKVLYIRESNVEKALEIWNEECEPYIFSDAVMQLVTRYQQPSGSTRTESSVATRFEPEDKPAKPQALNGQEKNVRSGADYAKHAEGEQINAVGKPDLEQKPDESTNPVGNNLQEMSPPIIDPLSAMSVAEYIAWVRVFAPKLKTDLVREMVVKHGAEAINAAIEKMQSMRKANIPVPKPEGFIRTELKKHGRDGATLLDEHRERLHWGETHEEALRRRVAEYDREHSFVSKLPDMNPYQIRQYMTMKFPDLKGVNLQQYR